MADKWDLRLLGLAREVSSWSKDPSTKVGAVIADRDHRVISLGYNGFPRGMPDDEALYNRRGVKVDRVIHAEMNALLFARVPLLGASLYTWPFLSCSRCCVHLAQAGISTLIAPIATLGQEARWSLGNTRRYAHEVGMVVREIWVGEEL